MKNPMNWTTSETIGAIILGWMHQLFIQPIMIVFRLAAWLEATVLCCLVFSPAAGVYWLFTTLSLSNPLVAVAFFVVAAFLAWLQWLFIAIVGGFLYGFWTKR